MRYNLLPFTDTNSVICKLQEIDIYESNWYRPSGGGIWYNRTNIEKST